MKKLNIALLTLTALVGISTISANTTKAATVTVKAGDTYKSIAESNGLSIATLEQANGREVGGFDIIYPGETITLPTSNVQPTTNNNEPIQSEQTNQQQQPTTTQSSGQFKISYYDPAVLGSNMGYGGVAANLSVFPKGTQLQITLSNGQVLNRTVNDTGTFAYSNPYQLDVAMPNNSIPSSGVDVANVSVIS